MRNAQDANEVKEYLTCRRNAQDANEVLITIQLKEDFKPHEIAQLVRNRHTLSIVGEEFKRCVPMICKYKLQVGWFSLYNDLKVNSAFPSSNFHGASVIL